MSTRHSRVGHYLENRPFWGGLADADVIGGANIEGRPPEAVIFLKLHQGRIANAGYQTSGCGFLMASCSALLEMAIGRTPAECQQLAEPQLAEQLGDLPAAKQYCAELAVLALRNSLAKFTPSSSTRGDDE
jgi:NifU-like protein involved in Fe-S cluster formation